MKENKMASKRRDEWWFLCYEFLLCARVYVYWAEKYIYIYGTSGCVCRQSRTKIHSQHRDCFVIHAELHSLSMLRISTLSVYLWLAFLVQIVLVLTKLDVLAMSLPPFDICFIWRFLFTHRTFIRWNFFIIYVSAVQQLKTNKQKMMDNFSRPYCLIMSRTTHTYKIISPKNLVHYIHR